MVPSKIRSHISKRLIFSPTVTEAWQIGNRSSTSAIGLNRAISLAPVLIRCPGTVNTLEYGRFRILPTGEIRLDNGFSKQQYEPPFIK
jgi:hypothetical protein